MISIFQGDNSDIAETILSDFLIKNYEWALTNIELKGLTEFLKEMKGLGFSFSKYKHHGGSKYYLESGDTFISLFHYTGERFYIDLFSSSKEVQDNFYSKLDTYFIKEKESQIFRSTFYVGQNLETKEDRFVVKDFEEIIPEYYPDFIDINEFIRQFMKSNESIFILSGKTGTGKSKFFTYIMKYLLMNPEVLDRNKETDYDDIDDDELDGFINEDKTNIFVGYLKNENILSLDQFWLMLLEREYDLVILDDLDYYLSPRSKSADNQEDLNKDKFISQLLSFTDGITKHKTKFLISTNKDIGSVDEALLRPGRLFGIFSFDSLTNEQAFIIWEKEGFSKKDFTTEFGEGNVLQSKLGSKINEFKINEGKAAAPFLKKGSKVDISNKFKKDKKIGF